MKVKLFKAQFTPAVTTPETKHNGNAALEVTLAPSKHRQLLVGKRRGASDKTSGVHARMNALLGKTVDFAQRAEHGMQSGLLDLEQSVNALLDSLFGAPVPSLVLAGSNQSVPVSDIMDRGDGRLLFAKIRDMLRGHGNLKRNVPDEYLDQEYEDVKKEAKTNNKAKKAKKIAEQAERLSEKTKGK